FEKCNITSSSRGLCIQLRDEGDVGHVIFRDIKFVSRYHSEPWWGRGEAISFTVHPRTPETKIGKLHDVYVKNVSGRAENSIRISGCAASPIMDVRLENVAVDFSRWTKYPGGVYDNRPTKAIAPIEVHPFDGFNLRYAEHVILDNCAARWNTNTPAAYRSAVQTENGVTVKIFNFHGETEFHPILVK
ncbi:MAG TPA: glycoside hydrolase, partial [Verrucomicrobiae bacterium]